jgi:RNA polymerase II-associated factor 1
MPPTIQSVSRKEAQRKSTQTEKRSDLLCRVKYCNTLPDIPFEPKFITYPFEQSRFIQYNATSLERAYKHELLTEHDLGVTIDLINPETYRFNPSAPSIVQADEKILEEEILTNANDSKRSERYRKQGWFACKLHNRNCSYTNITLRSTTL